MTSTEKAVLIIFGTLTILSCICCSLISYRTGQKHPLISPVEPIKEKVDTLVIRDTITAYKPLFKTRERIDTIMVKADTIRLRDTLYVMLDKEQILWRDSLCQVYASGYRVNVDSVTHFLRSEIVMKEVSVPVKVRNRWGIGLSAGYGAYISGKQVSLSPYVGVGLNYNIISWK